MLRGFYLVICLAVAAHAAPAALEARGEQVSKTSAKISVDTASDVSASVLADLSLWGQYSAAAYCLANNNSPGDEVACTAGNCPVVEAATAVTSIEFQK